MRSDGQDPGAIHDSHSPSSPTGKPAERDCGARSGRWRAGSGGFVCLSAMRRTGSGQPTTPSPGQAHETRASAGPTHPCNQNARSPAPWDCMLLSPHGRLHRLCSAVPVYMLRGLAVSSKTPTYLLAVTEAWKGSSHACTSEGELKHREAKSSSRVTQLVRAKPGAQPRKPPTRTPCQRGTLQHFAGRSRSRHPFRLPHRRPWLRQPVPRRALGPRAPLCNLP